MKIARGDTPFIEVRQVGELDEKGKAIFSQTYKGKLTPRDSKYKFSGLLVQVAEMIRPMIRHDTQEQAHEDVMLLADYVDRLLAGTKQKSEVKQ